MKNYSVLSYDQSCSLGYWLFHQKECFRFPVVYKDGLVSRLKASLKGREPWGILCKGHIVSVRNAPKKMTPQEAKEYCDHQAIAGRCTYVPPMRVMRALLKNVATVNEIIRELGGDELESKWYMATNDRFTSNFGGAPRDDIMLGISLLHLDDCDEKGRKICWEVGPDTKIAFYPAVEV